MQNQQQVMAHPHCVAPFQSRLVRRLMLFDAVEREGGNGVLGIINKPIINVISHETRVKCENEIFWR